MKQYFELYSTQKASEVFTMPSQRMIKTLRECLQIETDFPGKPYGPADVGGSFFALYKRGYLDMTLNPKDKYKPNTWFVTTKGLLFLLSDSEKKSVLHGSMLLKTIYKLREKVARRNHRIKLNNYN